MREFYFRDKESNVAFRGFHPTTDINCLPFEYFRLGHAYSFSNLLQDVLKVNGTFPISDEYVRQFVLEKTDDMIAEQFASSSPHPAIHQLITDNNLSHKEQIKLLKGVTLTVTDILWQNREAQDEGYLLDIYHEEKYPEIFDKKKHPALFHKKR